MNVAVVPNLVNMADRVTPTVLNPGCASGFEVGRCHAADKHQRTTNRDVLFELLAAADSEAHHCVCHCP